MKKSSKKDPKPARRPRESDVTVYICAYCGKKYDESDYGALCRVIMQHEPACSLACNVALGQGDEIAPGLHSLCIGSQVRSVAIPPDVQATVTPRLRWVERFTFRNLKQGGVEPVQDRVLQQAWQDQSTGAVVWKDVFRWRRNHEHHSIRRGS
jgi:hypothetical protein